MGTVWDSPTCSACVEIRIVCVDVVQGKGFKC